MATEQTFSDVLKMKEEDITDDFLKRFAEVEDRVRLICTLKPACKGRGRYPLLYQYYLWYFCGIRWYIPWDRFKSMPSPETITRAYRKLKEKGIIVQTQKTSDSRAEEEEKYRFGMPKA